MNKSPIAFPENITDCESVTVNLNVIFLALESLVWYG